MSAGACFLSVFVLVCGFFVPGRGWWLAYGLALAAVLLMAVRLRTVVVRERRYRQPLR